MKRWPIVFVVVCVLAIGVLGAWKYFQIQKAMAQGMAPGMEPTEAVILASVQEEAWQPMDGAVGTVEAVQTVELRPELAGTITQVLFDSGSRVEAGQALVQFDVRVEEANLRAAVARENLARASLERQEKAVAMRASSAEELDIARAEVERAQAEIALIRTQIDKKTLVAPFPAKMGLRTIHPGQYVDAGEAMGMLQSASDELYVDFMVPQGLVSQVGLGQTVRLRLGGLVGDEPAYVEARVSAQESQTDPHTRTLRTRALVRPAPPALRPGMSTTVMFPRGSGTNVLTIPVMAVRRATFGDHVFVLVPDDVKPGMYRAKQRFITLGETIGARVIVTKGLAAGERIAAEGSFKLREDILVAPGQTGGGQASPGGTSAAQPESTDASPRNADAPPSR